MSAPRNLALEFDSRVDVSSFIDSAMRNDLQKFISVRARIALITCLLGGAQVGHALEIDGFTPNRGAEGESIRIDGSGFAAVQEVRFNGTPASFTITANTQIIATTPANATSGPITLRGNNEIAVSDSDFQVFQPGPRPFSVSPEHAIVGTIIEIEGELFGANTRVFFGPNNTPAQSNAPSNNLVRAVVPEGAQSGKITLCDDLGCNASEFIFTVVEPVDLRIAADTSSLNTSVGKPMAVEFEISNALSTTALNLQLLISLPASTHLLDVTGFDNLEFEQNGRVALIQFPALPPEGGVGILRLLPTGKNANDQIDIEVVSDGAEQAPQDNQLMIAYKADQDLHELSIAKLANGEIDVSWPRYPEAAYLEMGILIEDQWIWERVPGTPDRDELMARVRLTPSGVARVARLRMD